MEQIQSFMNPDRLDTVIGLGMNVLIALLIFIVGSFIAKKVKNLIVALAKKSPHLDNVEDITLFTTDMQTFDNQKIIIPNGKIWGEKIINHSHHPVRGVEMKFNVAYDDNIDAAKKVIHKVLADHPHILAEPVPFVEVETLTERSAELVVRPFTEGANYFDVRYSVPEKIMKALGAAGMTTPYPATRILMEK